MKQFEQQNENMDPVDGIRESLHLFFSLAWLIILVGMVAGMIALFLLQWLL